MINDAQYILAEKRLDSSRYKKWNDNRGGVDTLLVAKALQDNIEDLTTFLPETIDEEEEEGVDDDDVNVDDDDEDEQREECKVQLSATERSKIIDDDVPQAFSHWTYQYTQRESLVCDLQGVLTSAFHLTDPAIHSHRRRRGRSHCFGPTDHGLNGQMNFFRTHVCNPLCEALRLRLRTPQFKNQAATENL